MDRSLHGVWVKNTRNGRVGRIAYQKGETFWIVYPPRGSMGKAAVPTAGAAWLHELKFLKRERKPFWLK